MTTIQKIKYVSKYFLNIAKVLFGGKPSLNIIKLIVDLETYGHRNSFIKKSPVNKNGQPIPWYTYSCIEYLDRINLKKMSVFEYGTGNSSLYWASKAKRVVSVENNITWYRSIKRVARKNQKLHYFNKGKDYINSVSLEGSKFDVIIIDGDYRLECAKRAIKFLNDNGVVILDNSDWHRKTSKFLRNLGFFQVDFRGWGPINYYVWTTSIFLRNKASKMLMANYVRE